MSLQEADASDSGNRRNDLIISDGFPALNTFRRSQRLPRDSKVPADQEGGSDAKAKSSSSPSSDPPQDPIPRYPAATFPPTSALSFSPTILPTFLSDCSRAFTARSKDSPNEAYSAGATFFVPALMHPRCALEALALEVFNAHTRGLEAGRDYDPDRSGAEWWTLVLESPTGGGGGGAGGDEGGEGTAATAAASAAAANGDGGDEDDDDSDDEDDEVGMHFDADYGLEAQLPNYLLHPRVATVTYLSDVGVPTLVLDKAPPPPADLTKSGLRGGIERGWLSHPRFGKHLAFDGRLLHGAPGTFFPAFCDGAGEDDDHAKEGGDAKRRKLDGGGRAASSDSHGEKKRITIMVNVWLNHCPIDAELLDDEELAAMKTPWKSDDRGGDAKSSEGKKDGGGEGYVRPFEFKVGAIVDTPPPLETLRVSKGMPAAGIDETVLCGREVDMHLGATMEDCHSVSKMASIMKGGTAELKFEPGTCRLEVGKEVEDSDDGE